jgi:cytochrome c
MLQRFYYKGVRITWCALFVLAVALCACSRHGEIKLGQQATGGDVKVGEHLIYSYGCGTCHAIPGIAEANGRIGPTLRGFGSRYYIAGLLLNTPQNLFRWVSKPQEIDPATAMPNLGVTEQQARDIAAYLYTLQ